MGLSSEAGGASIRTATHLSQLNELYTATMCLSSLQNVMTALSLPAQLYQLYQPCCAVGSQEQQHLLLLLPLPNYLTAALLLPWPM